MTPTSRDNLRTDHHCVKYFQSQTNPTLPFAFHKDGETTEVDGRHIVSVNDARSYVAATLAGHGVAQLPHFMVPDAFETGQLVRVLPEWTIEAIPLYVVYPSNRHLSNKVRVFVDRLVKLLAGWQLGAP